MSYDMQAEGLNGVNQTTEIIAGAGWSVFSDFPVLRASGTAIDVATSLDVDGIYGEGNLQGDGVIGYGGRRQGTGVVGVAGSAAGAYLPPQPVGPPTPPGRGKDVGVFGIGGEVGVVGQAGGGDADGVQGFGSGSFSGVAGFGDPAGTGTGVFGQGRGLAAPGVRGIGSGGPNTVPGDPCGVYGQAGKGNANGVEGHGSGPLGAGVAGFGDRANSGAGVFGEGLGPGAPGVRGIGSGGVNTVPADPCGVYGQAGSGNANGVEGVGSGEYAGVAGFGDRSNSANNGIGVFATGGAPRPASFQSGGPGVHAIGGGGAPFTPLNQAAGVFGLGGAGDAPGVIGQGGTTVADGVQGFSASGSGVSGESDSGVGIRAFSTSATGLVAEGDPLVPGTIGLIAAGNAHAAIFNGKVLVNGDFAVSGKKSAVVPFPDGSHRRLYCLESPESWFEDFGFAELVNGQAHVRLDPDFSAVVDNDTYHVFITEYEHNNALYVTKRTSTSFEVRTNASTMASGTFSYRVVSKRKDILAPRFEKIELPAESRESTKDRRIPKRPRGGGAAKPGNSRSEIS